MRRIIIALIFLFSFPSISKEVDIGGVSISIPQPQGFVRVTEKMPAVYKYVMTSDNPNGEVIDAFIEESQALRAFQGELPDIKRRLEISVLPSEQLFRLDAEEFAVFKSYFRENFERLSEKALSDHPGVMKRSSEMVSQLLMEEVLVGNSDAVYLPPHFEDENQIVSSVYVKSFILDEHGSQSSGVFSATTSTILIRNLPLYVMAVGAAEDLEWTRKIVADYAQVILDINGKRAQEAGAASVDRKVTRNPSRGSPLTFLIVFGAIASYYFYKVFKRKG